MSVSSGTNNNINRSGSTPGVSGVTPAAEGTGNTNEGTTPEVQGSGKTVGKKIKADGLTRNTHTSNGNSEKAVFSRGENQGYWKNTYQPNIDKETGGKGERVSTGYIDVSAEPLKDGFRVTVDTHHAGEKEKLSLYLQIEAYNAKNEELRTITLTMLEAKELMNESGYLGQGVFDLKYADLDKFIQAKTGNKDLCITPGQTRLFVSALWEGGHRAGGPGRGAFIAPKPQGAAASAKLKVASIADGAQNAEDIPLDRAVQYDSGMFSGATKGIGETLLKDGYITTRLESEFKGTATEKELTRAIDKMYELSELAEKGDKKAVEAELGKDWTVEPMKRHYLKDASGNVERDPKTGWPKLDPMKDTYVDDKDLSVSKLFGAIRLRTNEQKSGVLNVKPGGGRTDQKTGITQRVEVGYELKPGATVEDVRALLVALDSDDADNAFKETIFNHANREMHQLDPYLKLSEALDPWLNIVQERHKFQIKNTKTGVEMELSLDFVDIETIRPEHADANGQPRRARFCIVEGELDHLQTQSKNSGEYMKTKDVGAFLDDKEQSEWMAKDANQLTFSVEPQLHKLADLENPAFRSTSSYKQFEAINEALKDYLFPRGLKPAVQKAAQSAQILGFM